MCSDINFATFYKVGMYEVAEIQDAHKFLAPLLGTKWAPILFAVALSYRTKFDDNRNIGWPNYHGRLS
jgi:hypothetical protein